MNFAPPTRLEPQLVWLKRRWSRSASTFTRLVTCFIGQGPRRHAARLGLVVEKLICDQAPSSCATLPAAKIIPSPVKVFNRSVNFRHVREGRDGRSKERKAVSVRSHPHPILAALTGL